VRGVRHPASGLSSRHNENERSPRNRGKAEGIRGGADEDLRGDSTPGFLLMVDDRAWSQRNVDVMPEEMRVQRLTVMVLILLGVEMHVHQRRADRTNLHEHSEGRGGQPAKHPAIVIKDERPGT